MRWFIIVVILMSLVSACSRTPATIVHGYSTNYTIGETKTAYTGQKIVAVKEFYVNKMSPRVTFRFMDNFTLSAAVPETFSRYNLNIKIEKGKQYDSFEKTEIGGVSYDVINMYDATGHNYYGILVDSGGNILKNTVYYRQKMREIKIDDLVTQPSNPKAEKIDIFSNDVECKKEYFFNYGVHHNRDVYIYNKVCGDVNYELIFGGINDVSFNVNYREFTRDDLARPSFFQNLVYRTNEKDIRFKDIKIDVIEVNSQKIVYKVVEDGGLTRSEFIVGPNTTFEQFKDSK